MCARLLAHFAWARWCRWLILANALVGCDSVEKTGDDTARPPNIILFIADDYGIVSSSAYLDLTGSERVAPTPTIDLLCQRGVRFTHAWASPTCTPTRAMMLTGRHALRTNLGAALVAGGGIAAEEIPLPRLLGDLPTRYGTANLGKWHLGQNAALGGTYAPNTMGWEYYAGSLVAALARYDSWARTENGSTATTEVYATTKNVDDAIAYLDTLEEGRPFFLWVAFNAPHTPHHRPPAELHSYDDLTGTSEDVSGRRLSYFEAMVEAMDSEMRRLLDHLPDADGDGLPDNTVVLFIGDNGTNHWPDGPVMPPPYEDVPGKGTLYEHGLRVPFCAAGEMVVGGRDVDALVSAVDVFATVLDIAGYELGQLPTDRSYDSTSILPLLRNESAEQESAFIYAEQFAEGPFTAALPQGAAVRDHRHRLIRHLTRLGFRDECYDLDEDPLEQVDLLAGHTGDAEEPEACRRLRDLLLELACSESDGPWEVWCP